MTITALPYYIYGDKNVSIAIGADQIQVLDDVSYAKGLGALTALVAFGLCYFAVVRPKSKFGKLFLLILGGSGMVAIVVGRFTSEMAILGITVVFAAGLAWYFRFRKTVM